MVNERMETRVPNDHDHHHDHNHNRGYDHHHDKHCMHKRISWSAIVMGALVGLGLGFLLNIFGFAIGLSAFTQPQDGATTIAIGGFIGMIIGVIATMGAAGYTAGYLGRYHCPQRNLGIIYGFGTWTLALIFAALIAGPITQHAMTLTQTAAEISQQTGVMETGVPTSGQGTQAAQTEGAQDTQAQAAEAATQPSTWAWGMFLVFVLFFIGALSSCLGALWGMSCKRND